MYHIVVFDPYETGDVKELVGPFMDARQANIREDPPGAGPADPPGRPGPCREGRHGRGVHQGADRGDGRRGADPVLE